MIQDDFWKAVRIWSKKPHVVNKRVASSVVINSWTLVSSSSTWTEAIEKYLLFSDLDEEEATGIIGTFNWEKAPLWTDSDKIFDDTCCVSLRKLLPKQPHRHKAAFELEFIDFKLKCAFYIPLKSCKENQDHLLPPCAYAVLSEADGIDLKVYKDDKSGAWLLRYVLPKLRKWRSEMSEHLGPSAESHRLISVEDYDKLYRQLKEKYVPELERIWPECTDPQKFIHEDVAIATYLILLWRQEREELLPHDKDYRQSFFDIGCGNGLLVYLLTSEGHPGKGIDIRPRKIWSLYPPEVKLEVSTLTPSESTSFLDFDWLLGNHSDELTPWIPVIALQSTIQRHAIQLPPTRFWVLPCCPFSFWGKFERGKSSLCSLPGSRYAEYLHFVAEVGRKCGYRVEEDRMRIPSTRRTCLVGYVCLDAPLGDWKTAATAKSQLVSRPEGIEFQPRPAVELVRNCTRVDRSIQDEIVRLTAQYLLSCSTAPQESDKWNPGGTVELPELVTILRRDFKDFDQLKNECGGIQTLLRNHSHIYPL
nr:EOG090X07W1 [Ilyocryptus agilis]